LPLAAASTGATAASVAVPPRAVVLFADMVEAAVGVAVAAALAAMALPAIPHRQSCPISGRVPILV
jgi:hypothetical protein